MTDTKNYKFSDLSVFKDLENIHPAAIISLKRLDISGNDVKDLEPLSVC